MQTILFAHHELHEGDSYGCIGVIDLSINNILDLQLTAPNTTEWVHLTISYDTESETIFELYENVTISTPGAVLIPINHNRNSLNASGLTIKTITNTNLTNANADTAIAGATLLATGISGAGRSGGDDSHDHEWILKQNEDYTLRFTATAAGYTDYHLEWYEHTSLS